MDADGKIKEDLEEQPVRPTANPLGTLGQLAGLGAGLATLVYASGLAVMLLRLDHEQLPSEAVAAHLPREFLVTVGLTEVVLPLAVVTLIGVGVNFAVLAVIPGVENLGDPLDSWTKATERERATLVGVLAALAAAGLVVALAILATPPLGAVAAVAVTLALLVVGGRLIRSNYRGRLRSGGAFGWTAVLVALCFTPWWIAAAEQRESFPDATLCTRTGGKLDGLLVGETDDRIYMGEKKGPSRQPRRIAGVPRDEVTRVLIGSTGSC